MTAIMKVRTHDDGPTRSSSQSITLVVCPVEVIVLVA